MLSFFARTDALGVVLPSNSPGVHSLWAPATVLEDAAGAQAGQRRAVDAAAHDPRVDQGRRAGRTPSRYYPTDHAGGNEILRSTGRGMVFGDVGSTKRWKADGRVEVHGPGYSKVVIGPDVADEWEQYIDVIAESISNNGGRSCVNASGVWVTKHADAIAEALAEEARRRWCRAPADDPEAVLAPFADPETAQAHLGDDRRRHDRRERATARDVSAGGARRRSRRHGARRHLPAADGDPLRRRIIRSPTASSCSRSPASSRCRRDDLPDCLGPSLVVTCISNDPAFRARFVASPHVDRLNFGPLSTTQIGWDQPHEGNLFEHLYARRAIQRLA